MIVNIKKLHTEAKIPTYGTEGSACFDFYSLTEETINSRGAVQLRTGVSVEVPKDHVMLIFSRSGHGFKEDVRLSNCVGVIDSDYRGEIRVKLKMDREGFYYVNKNERIAQGMVIPVQQVKFIEVEELTNTKRDQGGFGHTGK